MLALPPVAPVTGWRPRRRLPRDHYVRLDSNDYSVHPSVIGRRIEVIADLDRVRVFCDGRLVADHDRVWARHQIIDSIPTTSPRKRCAGTGSRLVRPAAELEVEQPSAEPTTTPPSAPTSTAADAGRWRSLMRHGRSRSRARDLPPRSPT